MNKYVTSVKGESYTHKILWSSCLVQLEQAGKIEHGSWYCYLSALLMAYLTFESYLNFLGDRLAPDIWENEKNFFSKGKYRGTEGKLKKLIEVLDISVNFGISPYQSLQKLKNIRDFVVHGKPEKYNKKIKHKTSEPPSGLLSELRNMVEADKAHNMIGDVELMIEQLHASAKKISDLNEFIYSSLGGLYELASRSTKSNT